MKKHITLTRAALINGVRRPRGWTGEADTAALPVSAYRAATADTKPVKQTDTNKKNKE
ncbi:hypothetical protein [Ostreibacterium oceani]|uniref:hypothetical protein n=1 Tax=Ostreibacterium oceani TaxID=2654998 RepID=UPI001C403DB6|nr:hypothetical protein [Ostreibacterium oceani]